MFPGLPQGSPLSPVLFLFYNADLVEKRISNREGSIAFVDDYTAWVVGENAEANTARIRDTVDHALYAHLTSKLIRLSICLPRQLL